MDEATIVNATDQNSKAAGIDCPNCGFAASGNYCANCGQQTHLHKDSFWGLISHFIAHYFHYDSKFWRTLSTLVMAPGKLTLAYQQKKRQRYIPPISLYIFVSIVFFILLPLFQQSFVSIRDSRTPNQMKQASHSGINSVNVNNQGSIESAQGREAIDSAKTSTVSFADDIFAAMKENPKEFKERLLHSFPKIFFFMIPVLAALLKLFLIRRKRNYFVDHAVFALHIHSFVFVVCLIPLVNPFVAAQGTLSDLAAIGSFMYFVMAMHRVYEGSWWKSCLIGAGITVSYFFIFILAVLVGLWLISILH